MSGTSRDFCDGITRRNLVQAGLAGVVGLTLPDILRLQTLSAETSTSAPKTSIIYLEMAGGPTQHETYDPKPLAPKEFRGPFKPVQTKLPGVQFSQLMVE